MSTPMLISHRLFVAALNHAKAKGVNPKKPPILLVAAPVRGFKNEIGFPPSLAVNASQVSLLNNVVSVGYPLLRA
jgi:hypothetical protein